jgi:N-acetylglucosamine kinase-like BadF-type ATPase
MHVLGIDAGASKTVCLRADAQGRVLAEARGPGANLAVDDELAVEKTLHALMEDATRDVDEIPAVVCLGMAGVDRPEDGRVVRDIMRRIGYRSRVLVVNDALIALVAGVGPAPGVVVVAGTGAITYGRNAANEATRAAGWGHVLDDEGGGYWIGVQALRAVMRQADGRGPATGLTERLLAHFRVAAPSDLVRVVYSEHLGRPDIAALTRQVEEARRAGDAVAGTILEHAVSELTAAAASVTGRLGMADDAFRYVLAGGVFRGVAWLAHALAGRLSAVAPKSTVVPLDVEPAIGAVHLALEDIAGRLVLPASIA